MTLLTTVQNSFSSGELDPRLLGQTNIKAYQQGVKRARNVARLATGGFERRYGTYDLSNIGARSRLVGFEFSETQRYLIAFADTKTYIFDLNGDLLQTITGCPWNEVQAFEMTCTQQGDVMIICHIQFATRELTRTGSTTFSLGLFAFDVENGGNKVCQPYYKFVAPTVTLIPSGVTGAITLTTSSAVFVAGHVGTRFRVQGVEVLITAITSGTVASATVMGTLKVKLDPDPFKTKNGSLTVEVLHIFHGYASGASVIFSGCNDVGGVTAANLNGARVITVIDEHTYTFTAGGTAATASIDGGGSNVEINAAGVAIRDWSEQAISVVRGWPGACAFHEGRLGFAGTGSQPDAEFLSKSLAYRNFDVGVGNDGDSVQLAVGTEDISRILHMVSNSELQLLTATRELVHVQSNGEPITPANVRVKSQSIAGSGTVQPMVFDGATIFIQENGQSVSELTYSNEQGGYLAVPVSTLAGHLINNPTTCCSSAGVSNRSEQYALFSNADGTVAVFQSLRSENLAGWMLWELGAGEVQSVEAVGTMIFFCVSVRGQYRLYRLSTDQIVSLDGAVSHATVTAKTNWTLDNRVRGRTVSLVSELGYHGLYNVPSSGAIVLDVAVNKLVAGDDYRMLIETLPPEVQLPSGSRTRLIKRLLRSVLELYNTYAIRVDGQKVITLEAGEEWQGPITPITGASETRHLGFDRSPTVVIDQDAPLPATVLAITQEVNV